MTTKKMKKVLLLLAAGLCIGMMLGSGAWAEEHGSAVHEQQVAVEGHAAEPAAQSQDAHAAGEAAHGEGHGGGHAAPMVTKEKLKDLFWRAMNFAALLVLLVKFAGKPVADFLGSRRRDIEEDLKELLDKRDAAERSYKEFEARLAGMENEMELAVSRAVVLAEKEKAKILAEADKAAQEIRRQAEAAVQTAAASVRKQLQAEAAEQAAVMAEQLIIKNLTPADQITIIEQYLEKAGSIQ